jgi:hypothetical protein
VATNSSWPSGARAKHDTGDDDDDGVGDGDAEGERAIRRTTCDVKANRSKEMKLRTSMMDEVRERLFSSWPISTNI